MSTHDLTEEQHWKLYPGIPVIGCSLNKCENPEKRLPHCEGCTHLNNLDEMEKRKAKMIKMWLGDSKDSNIVQPKKNVNSTVFDDYVNIEDKVEADEEEW